MAFSIKRHRRRRLPRHPNTGHRLSPLAIAGIVVGGVSLLTVIIGNILKATLDEEAYRDLTEGKTEEETLPQEPPTYQVQIQAPDFTLGQDPADLAGYTAASVALNLSDGSLTYTSPVAIYQNRVCGTPVLGDTLSVLKTVAPFVSGIYRVQGLEQIPSDLVHAQAMEEGALLREFLLAGGSEVLLTDLPFDFLPFPMITDYVQSICAALGEDAVLGVAVPLTVAERENGWEIINQLLDVCQFCVLDLRGESVTDPTVDELGLSPQALEILARCDYYRKAYGMRLMIAANADALIYAVQYRMIPNYQLIPE